MHITLPDFGLLKPDGRELVLDYEQQVDPDFDDIKLSLYGTITALANQSTHVDPDRAVASE